MNPRRTRRSNFVFRLEGNEDNDLWVERAVQDDGHRTLTSTWVPSDAEREAIAKGANIDLIVWGHGHPAVAMTLSDAVLGKTPRNYQQGESDDRPEDRG